MSTNSELVKVYIRDESKLVNAPFILVPVLTFEICTLVFSFFVLILKIILNDYDTNFYILLLLFIFCLFHGIFCDFHYNWYQGVRYEVNPDKSFKYFYRLDNFELSNNKLVVLTVDNLTRYKLVGKKEALLYGSFTQKRPLKGARPINKVRVRLDLKEREEIIDVFRVLMERGV